MSNNSLNKPWSSQIELTFGCDDRCPMCYSQVLSKPPKEYDFMSIHTANTISTKMRDSGWDNIRLEFAMRGEPTLNPNFHKIIRLFHKKLPHSQIMVTTNGNHSTPQFIKKFFNAGGNILMIDCYHKNIEKRRWELEECGFKVVDFYEDDFNPYHRHNPLKTHIVCLVDDIKINNKKDMKKILCNHGGNVDYDKISKYGVYPLNEPLEKKCTKPFREIVFFYDGTIPLCCEDANGDYYLSNVHMISNLDSFWKNNLKLNNARLLLYNKRRNFPPCEYCDYFGGMRQGFLPKMKKLD